MLYVGNFGGGIYNETSTKVLGSMIEQQIYLFFHYNQVHTSHVSLRMIYKFYENYK